MFAYIKGNLEMKYTGYVVIDVGGIGYKVYMSDANIEKLGNIGDMVKVYTYYYVREDNISLYGFNTSEELKMFELLLGVSGIGAKSAIIMLSNITPSSFAFAIISNDTTKLTKIPGIGAKTAARIVLELKDKLKTEQEIQKEEEQIQNGTEEDTRMSEAESALQVLGYHRKEIRDCFAKMDCRSLTIEEIIRKGLSMLAR